MPSASWFRLTDCTACSGTKRQERGWFGLISMHLQYNTMLCIPFPIHGLIYMRVNLFIFTLLQSYFMQGIKFSGMIHHNSSNVACKKNKKILAITVSDRRKKAFSLQKALWQVHCGRIDSYIGGKWIVITCLFLMTFGWVPSDLLQDFWIGLPPSLQLVVDSSD